MQKQLFTNHNGKKLSILTSYIVAIHELDVEKCSVFVAGSDEPFYCSESYETIQRKLEIYHEA